MTTLSQLYHRLLDRFRPGWMRRHWLEALESGEFLQCRNALRRGDNYCCLGVACEVYRIKTGIDRWKSDGSWDGEMATLPPGVARALGVERWNPVANGIPATVMNDQYVSGCFTFPEIAAAFRREWGLPR